MALRVLVTGAGGKVGSALSDILAANSRFDTHAYSRGELDVTDARAVERSFGEARPQAVVHCAAMTDVDGCERDPVSAALVNASGTRNVAEAAAARDAVLIHISTDFVFDGQASRPYREDDPTGPLNEYGRTKLWAEREVAGRCARHFIVRSSWIYSEKPKNFVASVLDKARRGGPVAVVEDQSGSPTYAPDLAAALEHLLHEDAWSAAAFGTYHVANAGSCTRLELARKAIQLAKLSADVRGIASDEDGRAARRPASSALSCERWRKAGFPALRKWEAALADCVASMRGSGALEQPSRTVRVVVDERRRSVRHEIALPIRAVLEGEAVDVHEVRVSSRDVSLTGLGFTSERGFPGGSSVRLDIELPGDKGLSNLAGVVRWCRRQAEGRSGFHVGVALGPMRRKDAEALRAFLRNHLFRRWVES